MKRACRPRLALPVTLCAAGLLLLDALVPDIAAACAVCFGAAQSDAVQGLQAGILLLLGMVALVFAGVGGFLLAARRRIRRLAAQAPSLGDTADDESRCTGIARGPVFADQPTEAMQ